MVSWLSKNVLKTKQSRLSKKKKKNVDIVNSWKLIQVKFIKNLPAIFQISNGSFNLKKKEPQYPNILKAENIQNIQKIQNILKCPQCNKV